MTKSKADNVCGFVRGGWRCVCVRMCVGKDNKTWSTPNQGIKKSLMAKHYLWILDTQNYIRATRTPSKNHDELRCSKWV